jgi:hypothetical protein
MDDVIGKLVRFRAIVPLMGIIIEEDEHFGMAKRPGVKVLFWTITGRPTAWYYFDTIEGNILGGPSEVTLENIVSSSS